MQIKEFKMLMIVTRGKNSYPMGKGVHLATLQITMGLAAQHWQPELQENNLFKFLLI